MNLGEMRPRLRRQIGNPTTTEVSDADLTALLNQATEDITSRYRFHKARKLCTFPTVADQDKYDLPSDLLVLMRVADTTNFRKISKAGDRQASSVTSLTSGRPMQYVRYQNYLQLIPPPDGIYGIEIFYQYTPVSMSGDSDSPSIPNTWHAGVVAYAKYLYYTDVGDGPKQALAMEAFKIWISDKPTEIDEETVDIDSGVEIPTLSQSVDKGLDFNHRDD